MPNSHQHITCATRGERTLDHCYTPFKRGYKAEYKAASGEWWRMPRGGTEREWSCRWSSATPDAYGGNCECWRILSGQSELILCSFEDSNNTANGTVAEWVPLIRMSTLSVTLSIQPLLGWVRGPSLLLVHYCLCAQDCLSSMPEWLPASGPHLGGHDIFWEADLCLFTPFLHGPAATCLPAKQIHRRCCFPGTARLPLSSWQKGGYVRMLFIDYSSAFKP